VFWMLGGSPRWRVRRLIYRGRILVGLVGVGIGGGFDCFCTVVVDGAVVVVVDDSFDGTVAVADIVVVVVVVVVDDIVAAENENEGH